MIKFNCASCGQVYKVPADKAGVKAKCKKCESIMIVPAQDGPAGVPGVAAAAVHATPRREPDAGFGDASDQFEIPAAPRRPRTTSDTGSLAKLPDRPFAGDVEVKLRSRFSMILGIILMVSFFLPLIMSMRGRTQVSWVNLEGLLETNLPFSLRIMLLLPLVSGLFAYFGRGLDAKVRGITFIILGILPIVLLFAAAPEQILRSIQQTLAMGRQGSVISLLIAFVTLYGILIGCRLRWYRPTHSAAYPIALAGAICAGLSLVIPDGSGTIPLIGTFKAISIDAIIGLAGVAWLGILIAVIVLISINTPSTDPATASSRAILAYRLFCGGFIGLITIAMMRTMVGGNGLAIITVLLKMGAWMGATFMLVPMGVIDLLIGQPVTKPGHCLACGYDRTGATSEACPECGAIA